MPERSKEAAAMLALHDALRNVCINYDWTYSVFWTIRPRPRCRGGTNREVGKENGSLMLMWEDGFCHLERSMSQPSVCSGGISMQQRLAGAEHHHHHQQQQQQGGSTSSIISCNDQELNGDGEDPVWKAFRKMSIQLYNYGEGLMGKVASDKCHKWVFKESPECEAGISSYWQSSFDAHPPEWLDQFAAGIQTIAVIQAGQGLLQLGSCKMIAEDLHFVLRMRHAFESLDYPSGLFMPPPFAGMRSNGAGAPLLNVYTGFPPPPSPHSWSLCTNLSETSARLRSAGLLIKPTPDTANIINGFDRPSENELMNMQSPRLTLNPMLSPNSRDPNCMNINKQGQSAASSPHKLVGKDLIQTHSLTPQKRDHGGVNVQEAACNNNINGDHNNVLGGSSHVASTPSTSKLYQRRFSLMPKMIHQGLPFLNNVGNAPSSISSLEALLSQRSPLHAGASHAAARKNTQ